MRMPSIHIGKHNGLRWSSRPTDQSRRYLVSQSAHIRGESGMREEEDAEANDEGSDRAKRNSCFNRVIRACWCCAWTIEAGL